MQPETIIQLHADGRVTRQVINEQHTLLNPTEFFNRFASARPSVIKCITTTRDGEYIHGAVCAGFSLVCFKINEVTIKSSWTAGNPSVPDLRGASPQIERAWQPPLATWLVYAGAMFAEGEAMDSYLFVIDDHGQCYRPPIPNIHPDGRVCLGRNPVKGSTLISKSEHALSLYNSAPCNSELNHMGIEMYCEYAPDESGRVCQTPDSRRLPNNCMQVVSTAISKAVQLAFGFGEVMVEATEAPTNPPSIAGTLIAEARAAGRVTEAAF